MTEPHSTFFHPTPSTPTPSPHYNVARKREPPTPKLNRGRLSTRFSLAGRRCGTAAAAEYEFLAGVLEVPPSKAWW